MSRQTGFSAVTVQNAYGILESEGIISARPRSGYYVNTLPIGKEYSFPSAQDDFVVKADGSSSTLQELHRLKRTWSEAGLHCFGHNHLSDDLLPCKELVVHLLRALRDQNRKPSRAGPVEGELSLREIITRRLSIRGQVTRANEILVTSSAQSALDLCLDAITKPGASVIIESPGYFPFFGALQRRQLKAIEIYSHPNTGLDPDQFTHLIRENDVSACILMPVHHFPTGVTYRNEVLSQIVKTCGAHDIPIIEYDIYGELAHGVVASPTLKMFDDDDLVLQIGGFSETLGPRYGIGWIANRRFGDQLAEQFFLDDTAHIDNALQSAIVQYFQKRSFDRHLRTLRASLSQRMSYGIEMLRANTTSSCAFSQPKGGFMCWIRVSPRFDSVRAAFDAVDKGMSIPPGMLFSVTGSFRNFIGINLSFPWDNQHCKRLEMLAEMISAATRKTPE